MLPMGRVLDMLQFAAGKTQMCGEGDCFGCQVTSGTINCGHASLHIKATATANDSTVAALAKLVEQASLQKSQTARLVEQFSTIYTPVVTALAAGLVFVPLAVGVDNIDDWIYLALVLLVTACPCALVISTPVTTVCGISRAAKQVRMPSHSLPMDVMMSVQLWEPT